MDDVKLSGSDPRPKVCHLIHEGQSRGGGGTFATACFPAYLTDFETFAITGSGGDMAESLQSRSVRTYTVPMKRPFEALAALPFLWRILRRERPAALIVHGQWGGMVGAMAGRAAGVPVILYYTHFPSFYTDWDGLRLLRNRLAEGVTCRLATKVVCLSQASRYQYLIRHLADEKKAVYVPNGSAPVATLDDEARAALRREFGLPSRAEGPVVVSVSRLSDQKRIDWLLEAWALVEQRETRARLIIVGDGPTGPDLHRQARSLGLKRCEFPGPRPGGYRYYQVADLGIICSMYEGLSLALIESMFCGCPMIGTNVDGIAELIESGRTGLLVPPGDPVALAEAILRLLGDLESARAMGQAAKKRAETFYRLDETLGQQIRLLEAELARIGR